MKKIIKYALILISIVAIVFLGGIAYIYLSDIPSFDNQAPDLEIEVDSIRLEEGIGVASMMCNHCHLSNDGKLGGAYMSDIETSGKIYAPTDKELSAIWAYLNSIPTNHNPMK